MLFISRRRRSNDSQGRGGKRDANTAQRQLREEGSLLSQHAQRIRRGSMPLPESHAVVAIAPVVSKANRRQATKPQRRSTLAEFFELDALAERVARPIELTFHPGRDSTLSAVYRQHKTRNRILESYRKIKNAMKELQERYVTSKECRNPIARYADLKQMIRDVIVLEKQSWQLLELPKHEPSQSPNSCVNRVMSYLDESAATELPPDVKASRGGIGTLLGSAANLAEKAKETNILETLRTQSTDDLKRDSEKLQMDIYKLIRKYTALRCLVTELNTGYQSSKSYPIVPRFSMLKTLIKDVLRAPPSLTSATNRRSDRRLPRRRSPTTDIFSRELSPGGF